MQVQVQSPLPSSIRSDRTLKRGGGGGDGRGGLEDLVTTRISE